MSLVLDYSSIFLCTTSAGTQTIVEAGAVSSTVSLRVAGADTLCNVEQHVSMRFRAISSLR